MGSQELSVEYLSKKKEYKEIVDRFKNWRTWQRRYFFCHYTRSLSINILEILLTDFEPLYHSGYSELIKDELEKSASRLSTAAPETTPSNNKRSHVRCRIPNDRLHHKHTTEGVLDSKCMSDYILRPNPIIIQALNSKLDTSQFRQIFLTEMDNLSRIYANWETYEFIYLIHRLFPFCSKAELLYLSSCVNMRIYEYDLVIRLPDSIIKRILSYLPPRDLCTTALVCRSWKALSYTSSAWRRHARNSNFMGLNFEEMKTDDTMWRRIYFELKELAKQKTSRPRMRFGSVIQSLQTTNDMAEVSRKNTTSRRRSLVPEMIRFSLRKPESPQPSSPLVVNVAEVQDKKIEKSGKLSTTPRKVRIVTRLDKGESPSIPLTPIEIPLMASRLSTAVAGVRPLKTPDDGKNLMTPDDLIERVASVHGSVCHEDEIAYEEVVERPRRHSRKHANFIKSVTGYKDWMSALATIYPLKHVMELLGHKQPVPTFQVDSLRVISGCTNGVLRIWDSKTGRPVKKVVAHNGAINSLQFDGYKIVTAGWDNFVKIFSISSLQRLAILKGHTNSVSCVFFNKHHLISASLDKTLRVYQEGRPGDATTYTCENVLWGHEAGVTHGDMNETHIFSSGEDLTIRLWCAKFYNPIRTIHCGAEIRHFTFDQDLIIAATTGKKLLFVDVKKELPSHSIDMDDTVNFIWLYGARFLTGDSAGLLKEWDLPSGALLRTLHGHMAEVYCIQANKNQIFTSSFDGSIKIWYLSELKPDPNN